MQTALSSWPLLNRWIVPSVNLVLNQFCSSKLFLTHRVEIGRCLDTKSLTCSCTSTGKSLLEKSNSEASLLCLISSYPQRLIWCTPSLQVQRRKTSSAWRWPLHCGSFYYLTRFHRATNATRATINQPS